MTNSEALKPCPFCGEVPSIARFQDIKDNYFYLIRHICGDGHTTEAGTAVFKTEEEVVAAWNRRVTGGTE
jgi:Lar family restriction alleviation protein